MPSQNKPRSRRKKTAARPAKPAPRPEPAVPATDDATREAEDHFRRGVITRGEAVRPIDGELPPGATHEIVEETEGELPKIVRKRFSLH